MRRASRRGRSVPTAARTTSTTCRRRVQRRPGPGPEVPLRLPPSQAVGGRGLPLPRRADPGLRQARGGAARRDRSRSSRGTSSSTAGSPGRASPSIRAMRILVHDSRFTPRDSDRFPRWVFLKGSPRRRLASGWSQADGRFVHDGRAGIGHAIRTTGWSTGTGIPSATAMARSATITPTTAATWARRTRSRDLAVEARLSIGARRSDRSR